MRGLRPGEDAGQRSSAAVSRGSVAGQRNAGPAHWPAPRRGGSNYYRRDHCWLLPPLQAHRISLVPLAVPAPLASRHRPDCTPVMVPLELTFHCWFVWPLQSQMITVVPLVVPLPLASRHLFPYTCSALPEV